MRILLKAAFSAKNHLRWLFFSFVMLFGMTVADQIEMITFGVIINNGSDFFSLFGEKGKVEKGVLEEKWKLIDREEKGYITKEDAAIYLSQDKVSHPIKGLLDKIKLYFQFGDKKVQKITLALLFIAITKAFLLFFSRYSTRVLAIKISRDLRQQYFEHIQTLSMSFYQKYNIGALSTRVVGDANQIAGSINSWITNYMHMPFTLITTLAMCFYLSWKLSCIIFIGVPFIILPVRLITRKVKKITRVLQKNQESFASVLIDFLAGIQTVKIFSMERYTGKKYRDQNDAMEALETKTNRYDLMTRPILHFITTFCLVVILFIGLYGMKVDLAEIVVFCGLLHLFYEPVRKFADENANVQRGIVAAERLFEVLNIAPEITDQKDAFKVEEFTTELTFQDVWFRYEEEWVLKGVSFTVKKGETVAIVGSTGAGKSTILQLIPRLYEVEKGDILIDGRSIKGITQKSLRQLISYVPQKPFLFNDTVRENIAYGKPITDEEILKASEQAHAHEFIMNLPHGYNTLLSEMGKNLSGGQQQRLAIARALAKKSPILVLDEATSSLDTLSEQKIKQAIEELRGEITQIIVAHRLSTIEHADRVIFLDHGEKVAEGSIPKLLEECPLFAAMWEASNMKMAVAAP